MILANKLPFKLDYKPWGPVAYILGLIQVGAVCDCMKSTSYSTMGILAIVASVVQQDLCSVMMNPRPNIETPSERNMSML